MVTTEPPMLAGREIWGFPKKLAAIDFKSERNMIYGTLERPAGIRIASLVMRPERLARAHPGPPRAGRRRGRTRAAALIDYLCWCAGGPVYYCGRDMQLTHRGMRICESDWDVFLGHAAATLNKFEVPEAEQRDLVAFVQSLKKDIVE